ncbi:MAG: FAD-dependent oxidoreductase [Deltaproteobacteria bacterium]|nr:FAD-dependent oxidoreductase [Deltaproteobacteria bacterium]
MEFVRLFEPIRINQLEIKNRIVMPSMGLLYSTDYAFNDRLKAFYRERARGGVGLMTIGPFSIDRVGSVPFMPGLHEDAFIEPLKDFIHELHRETDVKVAIQLLHMGRYAFSFLSGMTPMAPSAIASKLTRETPREMTPENIAEVQEAYSLAAGRAVAAGFDFVEVLACTGYLISQFLSPVTNQRTDAYGGSLENRMRFGLEVIGRVREAVGADTALGIRVAGNDFMEGGHTNRESALFARAAEQAGADAVNVTGGWHETRVPQLTANVPAGAFVYLARGIKEAVNIPVFASNRLGDPQVAERALRSGSCDMICWGRPLIADPDLPRKVQQGRLEEIVPCVACNQGCFDAVFSGTPVTCILNPRAGNEDRYPVEKTPHPKQILVAGGGPAGMQFAITAAQRGHFVTLFEQAGRLGGQVNLAAAPPGKGELRKLILSMQSRMALLGVKVVLNTPLTPERVSRERPDMLVVATGARPVSPDVPGADLPHVADAWEVLSEKAWHMGRDVVVVGGNATGCETAHFIAAMDVPDPHTFTFLMLHRAEDLDYATSLLRASGRRVTVIDMLPRLAHNVGRTARWSLMKSLRLLNVSLRPDTRLLEIRPDAVLVDTGNGQETLPADTVVMAAGVSSVRDLSDAIQELGVEWIEIGDAKHPGKITEAVQEGFLRALTA